MANRPAYPTKTLFNEKIGTLVIEPLTPEHKKLAFKALEDRGIRVLPAELGAPGIELGQEFALSAVASWKRGDGTDMPAGEKRSLLNQYDSLRESILKAANRLNEEFNSDVELEAKNS